MDDVAARAAVSKQTVYKHFADKQRLFIEVITSNVGRDEESVEDRMAAMPDSTDVPGDLRAYARWHLADVMQPERLRLRRMLIGEAERFPELARTWYASGPERSSAEFARWFAAWDRRGLVRTPDPGDRRKGGHRYHVLVLEVVAVRQVLSGVVGASHRHLDGLPGADVDGVLPTGVGG